MRRLLERRRLEEKTNEREEETGDTNTRLSQQETSDSLLLRPQNKSPPANAPNTRRASDPEENPPK